VRESRQITNHILMVRPAHFAFNMQTAGSNAFQTGDQTIDPELIKGEAIEEFDAMVVKLQAAGVQIHVFQDQPTPAKPDAIFPNNWISMHGDLARGTLVLYPMYAQSRRIERQPDIIAMISEKFRISRKFDFSSNEHNNQIVEGTGSMILDRVNGIVYANTSPRTDAALLKRIACQLNYRCCIFTSTDAQGMDIYHTNVMMALGEKIAVICLETVKNEAERQELISNLQRTGKDIIPITLDQMNEFAGNMLEVLGAHGPVLVMSSRAYNSLNKAQITAIERHDQIVHSDLTTIESYGGGSARCMMAEIFLPSL
jgi:hypothetical protein